MGWDKMPTNIKVKEQNAPTPYFFMIKIYRPVKSNFITQGFGKDNTLPSVLPIYQSMGLLGHDGEDFLVDCQDPHIKHGGQCEQVFCNIMQDLVITYIQRDDDKGYGIVACTLDYAYKFLWWHFDVINPILTTGSKITAGTLLGTSGDTGFSTGAHVHFGMYPYGEDENNGYKGAVDPTPYLDNRFVNDIITQINILKSMVAIWEKIISLLK